MLAIWKDAVVLVDILSEVDCILAWGCVFHYIASSQNLRYSFCGKGEVSQVA